MGNPKPKTLNPEPVPLEMWLRVYVGLSALRSEFWAEVWG